jgi:hypothetical protein
MMRTHKSPPKPFKWFRHLTVTALITTVAMGIVLVFFSEFDAATKGLYRWVTDTWILLSSLRVAVIGLIACRWPHAVRWIARKANLTQENTQYLLSRRWLYITALLLIEGLGITYMLTR